MSTLNYCAKQATAMADFATESAKSKMDSAIDSEESREEMIAARTQELIVKRMVEMDLMDVMAGLQSANAGSAKVFRDNLLAGDLRQMGVVARTLVHMYIEQDSEIMARDWMDKIDAEVAKWGVQ